MSIAIRSRPLDSLLLEDGALAGEMLPSAGVFGQTPESAMVNEIFNNPDAWSVQLSEETVDTGLNSGGTDTLRASRKGSVRVARDVHGESRDKKRSVRHSEGYHLKRKSKLQLEAFAIKPFESRHRLALASASSMSDSSSLASSTPSLNSSLPTVSDEDSLDSHAKSLDHHPHHNWRSVKDTADGRKSLMAMMEPSNKISPEAGERMSILWSHQNIFRAFPTPNGIEFELESPQTASPRNDAVAVENDEPPAQTVMKPRRNAPSLTISTTTRMTATTATTVITVHTPEKSSPPSVTLVSASATWSILELYGAADSPKPSPKPTITLPKTSGPLHTAFKASDLRPYLPPKSAFASKFTSAQLNSQSKIVELPADFTIPPLPRTKSKLRGPRMVPPSPLRLTMAKDPSPPPPPVPNQDLKHRKSSRIRPLPKPPRERSPPPPVPSLPSMPPTLPLQSPALALTARSPPPPVPPIPSTVPPQSIISESKTARAAHAHSRIPRRRSPTPPPSKVHKPVGESVIQRPALKQRKSSRVPPPPLPLSSPLPPVPAITKTSSEKPRSTDETTAKGKEIDVKNGKEKENANGNGKEREGEPVSKQPTDVVPVLVLTQERLNAPRKATPPPRPDRTDVVSPSPVVPPVPSTSAAPPPRPSRKGVVTPLPAADPFEALIVSPPPATDPYDALVSPPRPSRKNVVSPLPLALRSPVHKPSASESYPLPTRNALLPFFSGHKVSTSESFPKLALHGPTSATSHSRPNLRKSASTNTFALQPLVPLPNAETLAKRVRKPSTGGTEDETRPPFEAIAFPVLPGVAVSETEASSLTVPKDIGPAGDHLEIISPVPSASSSLRAMVKLASEVEAKLGEASLAARPPIPQDQHKVNFPSVESSLKAKEAHRPPPTSRLQLSVPGSPGHRKGSSLTVNSTEPKAIIKGHKKSASSVSFRPPFSDALLPDAATLAKRLASRNNSFSNGYRPPFTNMPARKGSISGGSRPNMPSIASDTAVPVRHKTAVRPNIQKFASDLAAVPAPSKDPVPFKAPSDSPAMLPFRLAHRKNSSSSSSRPTANSTQSASSYSSLRPSTTSPEFRADTSSTRRRNGSISVRSPAISSGDVPLPDPKVLAQRLRSRTPSSLDIRPFSDVSDGFTPSTASASKPSGSYLGAQAQPLPSIVVGAESAAKEPAMTLVAPRPIVASSASWIPQILTPSAQVPQAHTAAEDVPVTHSSRDVSRALPQRGSTIPGLEVRRHSRSRSLSASKTAQAALPPPPVPALHHDGHAERGSPALLIPGTNSSTRTPSPVSSILRSKTNSPLPRAGSAMSQQSKDTALHVHFPSATKEGMVIKRDDKRRSRSMSPSRMTSPLRSASISRGRQATTPTTEVVSPRGRSVSVVPVRAATPARGRSASVVPPSITVPLFPPPPIPAAAEGSQTPSSPGSRGRVSPFPSRPVSRIVPHH